jgi:hypothetical protein
MVLTTKHHLDDFRSIQVMLREPEHPLDAIIASKGHSCSETNHWMCRFFKNLPHGVLRSDVHICLEMGSLNPDIRTDADIR